MSDDWDEAFRRLVDDGLDDAPAESDIESIVIVQFPLAIAQRVVDAGDHIQDHACPMAMLEVADFLRTLMQLMRRTLGAGSHQIEYQEMHDFECPDERLDDDDE